MRFVLSVVAALGAAAAAPAQDAFPRRVLFVHVADYQYLNPLTHAAPGGTDAVTGEADAGSASACPHAWQNRLPAITGSPHRGQPPTGAPQLPQNLWPSPTDAPHRAHLSTKHL